MMYARIQTLLVAGLVTVGSIAWAVHPHVPDTTPDYGIDPQVYWRGHPYNPHGTNYDVEIAAPGTVINLASGASISGNLGTGNRRLVLAAGGTFSTFSLNNKDSVHLVCNDAGNRAKILGGTTIAINPAWDGYEHLRGDKTLDYADYNAGLIASGEADAITIFNDRCTNIYFKNIIIDAAGGAYSPTHHRAKNVFYDNCRWQNFQPVTGNYHHRGTVYAAMGNYNIWFHNCQFHGSEEMIIYFDGAQNCGWVNCYMADNHVVGGMLFLVNDDFSRDNNYNGLYEPDESMNPKYTVIYGCTIDENTGQQLLFSNHDHFLIQSNVFNGSNSGKPLIDHPDRCSQMYPGLAYQAVTMKFIGNRITGSPSAIMEIKERKNTKTINGTLYGSNYARIGRAVIRDNVIQNAMGSLLLTSGDVIGPNYIENNNNGSTTMPTPLSNQFPTISISSPGEGTTWPTLTDIPISATYNDPDGSIVAVDLYIDDIFIDTDTSAPFEMTFPYWKALTGSHTLKVIAMDNHGDTTMEKRTITIAAIADETNYVFSSSKFDVKSATKTPPVSVDKTTSINLNGATAALLVCRPNDIDQPEEAQLRINGSQIGFPLNFCGDGARPADTCFVGIPLGLLVNGANTIQWRYVNNIEGTTTGFSIDDTMSVRVKYGGEPDEEAPTTPTGLTEVSKTDVSATMRWTASTDNIGVAGYKVYRDDAQVGTTATTNYTDTGLSPSTAYAYKVAAYDNAGNTSGTSTPIAITTDAPDTEAPTEPTGLTCTDSNASSIAMAWNASTDNQGVAGYRVLRDGAQVADLAATVWTNTGLGAATTYAFAVCAYDAAGNTSSTSAPVNMSTTEADVLPPPWQITDVGSALAGTTLYSSVTEQFTIEGSGRIDSTGTADSFHYLYQPIAGSFEAVCHVESVLGHAFARAGLIARETLEAGSRSAWSGVDQYEARFRWRTEPNAANSAAGNASFGLPAWVRLVRSNNVFAAYVKNEAGDPWTLVGAPQTIGMSNTVYIGVMVNDDGVANMATAVVSAISLAQLWPAGEGPGYLWMEAEYGTPTDPFRIATNEADASGGAFVTTVTNTGANYSAAGDPAAGHLALPFAAPSNAVYAIWGRMLAPSDSDDSFFTRLNGGTWSGAIDLPEGPAWQWIAFIGSTNLTAGLHTLEIGQREDGLLFDKFLVTSDLGYTPADQGVNADSDGDGLPDVWERRYYGHLNYDGASDTDGDQMTAMDEYNADTQPTNDASLLIVEALLPEGGAKRLRWLSEPTRRYWIQWTTNLEAGGFATLQSNVPGEATSCEILDDVSGDAPAVFYKVRAVRP